MWREVEKVKLGSKWGLVNRALGFVLYSEASVDHLWIYKGSIKLVNHLKILLGSTVRMALGTAVCRT